MNAPDPAVNPASPANAEPVPQRGSALPQSLDPERLQVEQLFAQLHRGANWFNWVALFSLVNSAISFFKGGMFFVVGLGSTLIVHYEGLALAQQKPEWGTVISAITIGFALFVAAVLVGIGWLAKRRYTLAFIVGMVGYALDGLIFVLYQDWLSIAFHAFALWGMLSGLTACWQLNSHVRQRTAA